MSMMVVHTHQPTGSLLLRVEDPFFFRDLIPGSRTLDHPEYNLAVKPSADAVKLLRNLGFEMPAPKLWPGKFQPLAHQLKMVSFYLDHARCFNLSEMGSMKTASTLWAADLLMKRGEIRRAAILAPLSTLERVWAQEIFDVLLHRSLAVVHGSREKRVAALRMDVDFFIINHDGVLRNEVWTALSKRRDIELIVVDEGGMFRNAQTDRYKALKSLVRPDQRLWWLTGTPLPNAPTDAWAQARIVNPSLVPPFFGQFKRQTMVQVTNFKWKPRAGSDKVAFAALQPAIRFAKKDCIELPPVVTINLAAQLSKEQRDAFETMRNHMRADVGAKQITAVNAADKINKLRQILCGSCKVDDAYESVAHAPRIKTLREAIDSASAKVIIVVPFTGILNAIAKELAKTHSVGVLNGQVSIGARNRIIHDFKTTSDPHVLACHPKVMAHGLNLTEADTLVYYAPIYSNDETQQVDERFNRAGQTRKMTVVKIGAHPLEWNIYRDVLAKRVNQESVLSLYEELTRTT